MHFALRTHALALVSLIAAAPAAAQTVPDIEFVPLDATGGDANGFSVATNGTYGISGAPFHDSDRGAAYVFDLATGAVVSKLQPPVLAADDILGLDVAISENYAIVSSIWHGANGAVFVYDLFDGSLVRTIVAADGNADDRFGASLAVDGDTLAVGCPYDDWAGEWSGSVYIYDIPTGAELAKVQRPGTQPYDTFGIDVDIKGNLLAVGASGDSTTFDIGGKAYLYDWATGTMLHEIVADDIEEIGKFGQSVAISTDHLLVGAPSHDTAWGVNAGAVYTFDLVTGAQERKLIGSQGGLLGFYGEFIDASGGRAVIGQWYGATPGASQGIAYVVDVESGEELDVLSAPNGIDYDFYGSAVGIEGDSVVVGAYNTDRELTGVGSVYGYTISSVCTPDFTGDGVLDFFDLSAFIDAFNSQQPAADFTDDGVFDFFDLSAFLVAFGLGCP